MDINEFAAGGTHAKCLLTAQQSCILRKRHDDDAATKLLDFNDTPALSLIHLLRAAYGAFRRRLYRWSLPESRRLRHSRGIRLDNITSNQ